MPANHPPHSTLAHCLVWLAALCTAGCGFDAFDPFALAPTNSASTWSPMRGNTLISSQFCKTLLPPSFSDTDLTLADLLDIALQNNPNTQQTWASARAAAAEYGQNLSSYFPDIEFQGTYTRQRSSFSLGGTPIPFYLTEAGPEIDVTYTILDFGQRSSSAETARQALYYADWTHNQEIQTVLQTVMNDYYNYIYQAEVLRGNEENLENAQAALDAANQKFALGLAALGDVAQARTQFLQNKINLTTQKQNVENAFAQLATDLGLPSTLRFHLQRIPDQPPIDPILECVNVLVEKAQQQRPELLASLANLRSKEAALRNAKTQLLPTVTGTFDLGKTYFNGGQQEKKPHFTAELALSFPIFHGFYYRNGIRVAEANLEASRGQFLQTELTVIQSVTVGRSNVETAAQNLKDSAEYLQAAQVEFAITLANYKTGTMTILNVLSAQSSLADARTKRASAQENWFTSLAALAYATGSLCAAPCELFSSEVIQ